MQHLKSLAAQMAGFRTPRDLIQSRTAPVVAPAVEGLQPCILDSLNAPAAPIGLTLTTRLGHTPIPMGATGPSRGGPQRG